MAGTCALPMHTWAVGHSINLHLTQTFGTHSSTVIMRIQQKPCKRLLNLVQTQLVSSIYYYLGWLPGLPGGDLGGSQAA